MQACQAWSTTKGADTVILIVGAPALTGEAQQAAAALAPEATIRVVPDFGAPAEPGVSVLDVADPAVSLADPVISAYQALGIVVVAAAGDTGAKQLPQHAPGVATVSAVDAFGQLLPTSNSGPQVALAAYGTDTAAASGYVAASAALVRAAHGNWTSRQVLAQLAGTAHSITIDSSYNYQSGYGVIHPLLAVTVDGPPKTTTLPGFDALFPPPVGTAPPTSAGAAQTPRPDASAPVSGSPSQATTATGAKGNGTSPLLPVGVGLLVVAAVLLILRKRRRTPEPDPLTPPDEWQPPQGRRHSGYGTPPE